MMAVNPALLYRTPLAPASLLCLDPSVSLSPNCQAANSGRILRCFSRSPRLQHTVVAALPNEDAITVPLPSSIQKAPPPFHSKNGNGSINEPLTGKDEADIPTTNGGDGPLIGATKSRESSSSSSSSLRKGRRRRPLWLERSGPMWEEEVVTKEPRTISEYLKTAQEMKKNLDGGPPRWFCPLAARPSKSDLPVMFFVPGIDGTGLGLLQQEVLLSRYFELRCLNVPTSDRTSFDGLVDLVSNSILEEARRSPGKPLYIIAESFGACVALVVAARHPDLFLHLVLVNPATSFERTELKPLLPLLRMVPEALFPAVPFLFSYTLGDPVRMAAAGVDSSLPPQERWQKIANRMTAMIPEIPLLGDILPKATLMWKIELLQDGAPKANKILRDVKAQVLLLASGKDQMLPSKDEAKRLARILPRASYRLFADSGHTLLLEDGVDVMSRIKAAKMYKLSKADEDPVIGFFPPTPEDVQRTRGSIDFIRLVGSPVFFSTNSEGRIERGLGAVPSSGPLLFVGNHQLIGFDLPLIVDQILKEKGMLVRGLAHPGAMGVVNTQVAKAASDPNTPVDSDDPMVGEAPDPLGLGDLFRTFGAVNVSGSNMYKLLENGEAALLFPGGVREALKRKGENYKLFWPERSEFVRMAVRHGATIVPFSVVGVEDSVEILIDSTELPNIPKIGEDAVKFSQRMPTIEGREDLFISPILLPKLPQRQYFLFQKPIATEGLEKEGLLQDKKRTAELYLHVKHEVEAGLEYLQEKRKEDPYNEFLPRILYETSWGGKQAPTFPLR